MATNSENKAKFARISSISELESAQQLVAEQLRHKKSEVSGNYAHFKSFYTPASLFNAAVDKISPAINISGILVDVYDRITDKFDDFRQMRRERRERRAADREVENIRRAEEDREHAMAALKRAEEAHRRAEAEAARYTVDVPFGTVDPEPAPEEYAAAEQPKQAEQAAAEQTNSTEE